MIQQKTGRKPTNHKVTSVQFVHSLGIRIVVLLLSMIVAVDPLVSNISSALSTQTQITYTKVGVVKNCGLMQGGATDGQNVYFACVNNSSHSATELVKTDLTGKELARSKKYTRSEVGHANAMAYNNRTGRLLLAAWDNDGAGNNGITDKVRIINPSDLSSIESTATFNKGDISNICYNQSQDKYVANGRLYGSNYQYERTIYTSSSLNNSSPGTPAGQGIACDNSYIYVIRWSIDKSITRIVVYDWNGANTAVYNLSNINDEVENLFIVGGVVYAGVNSFGGTSSYFIKLDGVTPGSTGNCQQAVGDQTQTNAYKAHNNALISGGSLTCCNTVVSGGGLVGNTNGEKAYNFFITTKVSSNGDMPLSPAQAAGIVGNFMLESGGNTYNLNPEATNGTHTGIAQWDNVDRFSKLKDFATSSGTDWKSLETQLKFVVQELETRYARVVKDAEFKNAPNTEAGARTAAIRWNALYEIGGGDQTRADNAAKAFKDFGSTTPATGTTGGAATTTLTSTGSSLGPCGASFSSGDYVFPLKATQEQVRSWGNNPGTTEWASGLYHQKVFAGYYAVDIMAPEGTEVVAFHSGEVISTDTDSHNAYSVQIKDSDGYTYFYQHMDPYKKEVVKKGDSVEAGALIGYVGNRRAAWDSATHLHIDKSKNPGSGLRGPCTASENYCPIASEHRFVEIVKELHDSFEKLPETGTSTL